MQLLKPIWHYGGRLIITSAALRAAIKRPPKRKNRTTKPQRQATKASPLNCLAIAFVFSLGGVTRLFVVFGVFGIPSCGYVLYRAYDGL